MVHRSVGAHAKTRSGRKMLVAGIDPGTNGAVAVYDTECKRLVCVEDIPTWWQAVGKKKRQRVDPIALMELFDRLNFLGVELIVMEAVGGRPRQSASAGFVFGHVVGMLMMCIMYNRIMVETVPPQNWKKLLKVPGKAGGKDKSSIEKKAAQEAIMQRANELFPHDRDMFRTPRGAYRMDQAEAAMLARFGADFVVPQGRTLSTEDEYNMQYRNAETGA